MSTIVEFKHVSKRYRMTKALDDITFTIPKGKVVGLIGSNGSGKSTILKLMSGLVRPTKGKVVINGIVPDRLINRQVAYLSEADVLYDFYKVKEMVDFFSGIYADFDSEKAEEMLEFMKLDHNKPIKHLSKGQRGRLKLVLALSRQVPLILLDEPLSGLDPMVRESIIKGLISFIDLEKQTVIMTTHEVEEVEPLLDQVIAVMDGKLLAFEDVDTIRRKENKSIVDWLKSYT
ncbi:ABC transporter ATP-binding protein [Pseudalkalibacillus decolorationis]|uniref:ABC transporter ATP-binding protein n=1 Tax=Pseudalkalibacillus decolorationis TaxID=163879 RepID=UPI0027E2694E|nr:ABC transporter ATP-binding protein [Pseudalkalibacillus decolorationis]